MNSFLLLKKQGKEIGTAELQDSFVSGDWANFKLKVSLNTPEIEETELDLILSNAIMDHQKKHSHRD
jgi:hypothetical protein